MDTYCPSCGMNQPTQERTSGSLRQWTCVSCGLVLKEELDLGGDGPAPAPKGEQVLGRIPVRRMTTGELAQIKAADKASADKAAAERAAKAAALARAALQKKGAAPWQQQQQPIEIGEAEAAMEMVSNGDVEPAPSAPAPAPAPAPEPEPEASAPGMVLGSLFDRVLVCEDTALLREIVKDALVQSGISQHVRGCANGEEFLITVGEALAAGVPIDLAILDVEMPILNGYQTAIALRAFERGLKTQPTPLVFFTSYACDETFKRVLEHCQPARYLNKGADSAPPRIAARLVQVLGSLKR